jgi:hypothetical protein
MRRVAAATLLIACSSPPPPPPPPPKPVVPEIPTDTLRVPLIDLSTYYKLEGGLYPGRTNLPPRDHDSAARARRNAIKPLDVNGDDSPFGKIVFLSIGLGNASEEWCSKASRPPCAPGTLMARAALDLSVNRYTMVLVNGALDSADVSIWTSATSRAYERIKVARLTPLGLSENQVQMVWVQLADANPSVHLPADSADAYKFLTNLGMVARALKTRYPNLQLAFLSSRNYGGYSTSEWNPEPYAYEEGFSVKWLIESQISEMRGQPADTRVGTLNYAKKAAPILLWGPYTWADGATPRSDAFAWLRTDFDADGLHLTTQGQSKAGLLLLNFFKSSNYSRCWFMANQYCL